MVKTVIRDSLVLLLVLSTIIWCTNFYYAFRYPLRYESVILNEAAANNFDPDFICAVISEESRFNKNAVSESGAMGLMQLMPATAVQMAIEIDLESFTLNDLFDETINIRLGVKYLRYLKNKFFSIGTVLAAYNAGEGVVSEWLMDESYSLDGVTLITTPYKETNAYIENVMETLKIYRNKRG